MYKRSCQVLDERSIRSIPAFETELVEQRDFLWIDMGITRRDMEAIINECNKIKRFGSNMDAAIAAGMVQDHDAVAEDSDDEDAQILENLSHTNAAANAMGLVGPGSSSSSSSSGGRNTALSRLEDELATVESNVDSINSRILELNTSVASNASSQKRMLSELLSQQLTMENQMRERIRLQQERAGVQMSEAAKRARARAVETRVEMLEMLNAAMETSQIMMSTGAALAADQVARSAPSAVRAASDAAELAARQAVHTTLRNFDSIREGVQAGASRLVGGGGGSASSSREEEKDVKIVSRWNLDLSSPFLEYSPDAGAALNRAGIDPSQLIPDGGAGTGNSAASMLVLSSVFSMGDQASACVEVEFLPPPESIAS